jgi:hypothetical protein
MFAVVTAVQDNQLPDVSSQTEGAVPNWVNKDPVIPPKPSYPINSLPVN